MSRFFGKLHRDMNRVNVFAINRYINEEYGLIRIFIEKNTDFPHEIVACLPIDLVNQRRMPNQTVAPRQVKLRFWFFVAGGRFVLHNVAIFCKLHRDMNRMNVFAIHRCINEGYGLRQIFTEKIRISPTKLWRV